MSTTLEGVRVTNIDLNPLAAGCIDTIEVTVTVSTIHCHIAFARVLSRTKDGEGGCVCSVHFSVASTCIVANTIDVADICITTR